MKFIQCTLQYKHQLLEDTWVFRFARPSNKPFHFLAGQYIYIKNPFFRPDDVHPFSIASSPLQKEYLEFCIKVYGQWTRHFTQLKTKDSINISSPQGTFTWDTSTQRAVFLLGGIGIAPVMSMLRFLSQSKSKAQSLTILYGNRTPETMAYEDELEELTHLLPLRIISIFSHLPQHHPWTGYRGFITKGIVEKEIDLTQKPTFFIVGPPIFIEKMDNLLSQLHVSTNFIKKEDLSLGKVGV